MLAGAASNEKIHTKENSGTRVFLAFYFCLNDPSENLRGPARISVHRMGIKTQQHRARRARQRHQNPQDIAPLKTRRQAQNSLKLCGKVSERLGQVLGLRDRIQASFNRSSGGLLQGIWRGLAVPQPNPLRAPPLRLVSGYP